MKATIVKDNDFKTVGFLVTSNGKDIIRSGISPHPMVFCKEVDAKDWETDIIALIELQERLMCEKTFVQHWFEAAAASGLDTSDFSLRVTANQDRIKKIESKIENIINNII